MESSHWVLDASSNPLPKQSEEIFISYTSYQYSASSDIDFAGHWLH
jgi:hypothetical protein